MKYIKTGFEELYIVELEKREDFRGFFARVFDSKEFEAKGLINNIVQINTSFSKESGTLRGMHFQRPPHAETKFIRCIKGAIYDAVIDLRPGSETFKKWFGVELTSDNYRHLFVPEGFAHGFITLEDESEVIYLVSAFYNAESEGGVRYNDPAFGIKWPIEANAVSDKDNAWPDFKE